jgi:hypothetical protein
VDDRLPTFRDFIAPALAAGFDWAVDLYYPSPTKLTNDPNVLKLWTTLRFTEESRTARYKWHCRRSKIVKNFLGEIMLHAGEGGDGGYHYINVLEERHDFSSFNHILLGGCSIARLNDRDWGRRWHEISGSRAYDRVLDRGIGGLLHYFVMRVGCTIEIGDGQASIVCQKGDFFEWKPREQWLEEQRHR